MKGGGQAALSLEELRRRDWDSLTPPQRARLVAQEKNERANQASTKAEIDAVLAYAPNGALFGSTKYTTPWKFGLWTYNHFVDSNSLLGKWFFNTFGEAPILISNVAPQTRAKVATGVLRNHGYLRGKVDYRVVTGRNPKKAKIDYDITPGHLFFLDSVAYKGFDATADSLLSRTRKHRLLRSGEAFSTSALVAEQTRIEALMRNNGYYYFSPAYTTFFADTVAHPGYVQLQVRPAAQRPAVALISSRANKYLCSPACGDVPYNTWKGSALLRGRKRPRSNISTAWAFSRPWMSTMLRAIRRSIATRSTYMSLPRWPNPMMHRSK